MKNRDSLLPADADGKRSRLLSSPLRSSSGRDPVIAGGGDVRLRSLSAGKVHLPVLDPEQLKDAAGGKEVVVKAEKVRSLRDRDKGLAAADFVVRAMLSPDQWWSDLEVAASVTGESLERAGFGHAGSSKKRGLRRSYQGNMKSWTADERSRLARVVTSSAKIRVPLPLVQSFLTSGIYRDASRLGAVLSRCEMPFESLWIECDIAPPDGSGSSLGRTGFLLERTDPANPLRWIVSAFTVAPNGTVEAPAFLVAFDATGVAIHDLPAPYESITLRMHGIPGSFAYAGLGQLDNDRGLPSFRVPSGFEDAFAIAATPIYERAIGTLRNDVKARAGAGYIYDRAFATSIHRKSGHFQCLIPVLFALGNMKYRLDAIEGGRSGFRLSEILVEEPVLDAVARLSDASERRWSSSAELSPEGEADEAPGPVLIGEEPEEAISPSLASRFACRLGSITRILHRRCSD